MSLAAQIAARIAAATGQPFTLERQGGVGGGCINATEVLEGSGRKYFVKLNDASRLEMFAAEAEGLQALAMAKALRVPQPICHGQINGNAYLVLEYLELGSGSAQSLEKLGTGLAALHRCTQRQFGWHRANTIGSTPQINTPSDDWVVFYREHRLGYQLRLAAEQGCGGALLRQGEQLMDRLEVFFEGYRPVASLLHGDLWGGNYSAMRSGEPVIFDPAVYYGDRETDLAMTELFGGFGARFYAAYRAAWPLDAGYRVRKTLYNLYHVLNHFNLFGGGYAAQAEHMIGSLLADLR
jgi:fructosamine-3-kinase